MNEITVVSSNIRFDNPNDGNHIWKNRIEILSELINSSKPDFLGTQEGWRSQLYELYTKFDNLKIVDNHRTWIEERMYPTIFINPETFDVLKSGDIWLSETPNKPASKSFNSAFPRLCTWAKVKHQKTSKKFFLINAHLDHLETDTRQEQIKVLINEISKIRDKEENILFTGDFNEGPNEKVREILLESSLGLSDPWQEIKKEEEASHHKFTGENPDGHRIDWILKTGPLDTINIMLIKDHKEKIFPSDHFPVVCKLKLKN